MKHDPKLQHCNCGYSWRPGTLEKLVMLIFGKYVKRCPQCQWKMTLRLYKFVVCKEREKVDKRELWEHG